MSVTGTGAILTPPSIASGLGYLSPSTSTFQNPHSPNILDYLIFLNNQVQIPVNALPPTSPWPQFAFTAAQALVLCIPGVPGILFSVATYNCATHILFGITPDQVGQDFFTQARSNTGFGLNMPTSGVVQATSDVTTSTTLSAPDWAKGLTVGQLGFYKTPWGREYLAYQQSFGPTIVGLT